MQGSAKPGEGEKGWGSGAIAYFYPNSRITVG